MINLLGCDLIYFVKKLDHFLPPSFAYPTYSPEEFKTMFEGKGN